MILFSLSAKLKFSVIFVPTVNTSEQRSYLYHTAKATGAWLQEGVSFMQFWPMKY